MTDTTAPPTAPPIAPVVARTREELREARSALDDGDIAVVMTMGALHEGHATLIHQARKAHRHVVVTIFLNPLQFGPKEDLSRYPRTFDADLEICTAAGVDLVFAPTPDVVYPEGDPGRARLRRPARRRARGPGPSGALRRHAHGRRQAHAPDPVQRGLLRAEGRPAAAAHPPDVS